jgi:hypothetical protein
VTDAGCCLVTATTRSEDALGCDTLFYSGKAGEANALLVDGGGLSGVGVVRQRDPEHGDRKGQRHSYAVSRRMAYLIRKLLTPVERQTSPATLDGLALGMKSQVLRGMTPCPLVNSYRRFEAASYLHIHY